MPFHNFLRIILRRETLGKNNGVLPEPFLPHKAVILMKKRQEDCLILYFVGSRLQISLSLSKCSRAS